MWNRNLTRAPVKWHELTWAWERKEKWIAILSWIVFSLLHFDWCCEQFFQLKCSIRFISNFIFIFISFCLFYRCQFLLPHFGMNVTKWIYAKLQFHKAITKSMRCARTSRMRIDLIVNEVHFTSFARPLFFHLECKSIWEFKSAHAIFLFSLFCLCVSCSLGRCEYWRRRKAPIKLFIY